MVVTGGEPSGPSLIAYDRETGKPAWRGGDDKPSYCSPALATLGGRREVIVLNALSVSGHDSSDGHLLWRYPWPGNFPKVSQAVGLDHDRVFISAGYGIGCAMLHISADADHQKAELLWDSRKLKTEFTNVVMDGGFIYGLDDGVLTCMDEKGNRKWRGGRYGHGQILLAGKLLLVQSEPGDVALVDATPETFTERATLPALQSKTWNNPAIYGHLLLVRNDTQAACYELP